VRVPWLLAALSSLVILQDQQPPTFRSGVDVVVLDVTVLDQNRQPVRGLRAADFTVLEDGTPQPIVSVAELNAPEPDGSLVPWMREVAPDVRTNAADDRRIVTLVLDDALISFHHVPQVREIAMKIVDQLGPADQMCVIYTGVNQKSQEFTSDRAALRRAIGKFNDSASPFMAGPQYSIQTVRRASETLAALPERRKALIFISRLAVDFADPNDDFGLQLRMAIEAAQESNVTIFPINPAGLEVNADAPAAPVSGRTLASASPGSRQDLVNETLRYMANETGGLAVLNTNSYDDGVRQVFRETGTYYLVGFRSSHRDGRFRRIEVKTSRDDLMVRTRTRYRAPREERSKRAKADVLPVIKSVSGILPSPDVAVRVSTAPFAGSSGDLASVAIVIGVQQPAPQGTARVVENVQVMTTAFNTGTQAYRASASASQKGQIVLRPVDEGGDAKYEMLSRLDLRPGRYQLRFGVQSELMKKAGSVYQEIEIPDFRRVPLSMSGVVIGVIPSLPSSPKDYLAGLVPVTPTTQRNFSTADSVTAFLRIYQGGRKPALPTVVTTRIVDAADREVHRATESVPPNAFGTGRAHDLKLLLPLGRLEPGPYLLRVEAAAEKHHASREVRFFVRGR
jgi:VWFA-related protein